MDDKTVNRNKFVSELKKAARQLADSKEENVSVSATREKGMTTAITALRRLSTRQTVAVAPSRKKSAGKGAATPLQTKKVRARAVPHISKRKEPESVRRTATHAERGPSYKIAMVASECSPFAKTGGLADAAAGLSKALSRAGHEVRIIMPLYAAINYQAHQLQYVGPACVHMGNGEENWIGVHRGQINGKVVVWFVDFQRYFGRPGIYNDASGDYADNAYRYGLLSKAAIQLCKDFNFTADIMHLHDWPTAPVAAFLKTWDNARSPLSQTASVLTIHNIGYQGKYDGSVMSYFGLGPEHFTSEKFEDYGQVNLLKAGIHFADMLTTVSPTHAREVLEPAGGHGLTPYLERRRQDFVGILNGVDTEHWDPSSDPLIPARYSVENTAGKAVCKRKLQEKMGLEVDAKVPLFAIISRFAAQKGFNLLAEALPQALRDMEMQIVAVGSGDPDVEAFLTGLAAQYPGRVGVYVGYNEDMAHLAEAGSDFFLMPSLYEPCGLNQIYSLKYGTLPIVRATGGLDDTVENYHEHTGGGTGFKFWEPTGKALYNTMGWAISTWFDRPEHIEQMKRAAMSREFSWDRSARQYAEVYKRALANRRGA